MRVLVAAGPGAPVVAVSTLELAYGNDAWAGLALYAYDGEAFPGYPLPEGAEPVLRNLDGPTAEELRAYARERSYALETAGVAFGNATVSTDRSSQGMIDRAVALFAADPTLTSVSFDAGGTLAATLTGDQLKALGVAVGRHVQGAFEARAKALAAIADGSAKSRADVDAILAGTP